MAIFHLGGGGGVDPYFSLGKLNHVSRPVALS